MVSSKLLFVLLSASTALAAVPSKAKSTCSQFKSTLANITILPSDPAYQALATENWSATAWAKPACIVQPGKVAEAQQIVSALTNNGVPFAMRSGGHMPSPLAANINDGVLIDLVSLNRIDYNAAKNVVTIGAGLRWGQVYSSLEQYKVTVVGGRVLDVGVGGLTLGGKRHFSILGVFD
jgi:FAD/FMN-containing dehydrogenase